MISFNQFAPRLGLAAVLAATMLPAAAFAGEQTRAEAAIAEAKGKIDAGDRVGTSNQAPELQAQARAALSTAQDLLSHHKKSEAIAAAHHASELADQAIVTANTRKNDADHARRDDLRDTASQAQQSAASANTRAATAEAASVNANARADSAEQATTVANIRANTAEQSTIAANAQAEALRSPTTTTVAMTQHETVEPVATPAPVRKPRHRRVMHRHHAAAHVKTTTTTIVTTHRP